jgi:hypothetical protein
LIFLLLIPVKKQSPEELKTRPDLGDQEWLVWLDQQPENRGIEVHALYRQMIEWAFMSGKTPSRLRLLNWIAREREAMPMTLDPDPPKPEEPPPPQLPDCGNCKNERFLSEVVDKTAEFEWARTRMVPCPACNPTGETRGK